MGKMRIIWSFCLWSALGELVFAGQQVEYAPIVQSHSGKIRGLVKQVDGYKLHLYEGIRYGHANRFSKPEAVQPWNDVYIATKWRDACPQLGIPNTPETSDIITGTMSEDCLFLSVWRPAEDKSNRTVMVWIHGGGYYTGTIFTSGYNAGYLAGQGDVVVVSINYRLGAFGFLFGGTVDSPGNVGLHDQVLALQWIKTNIRHFGGDPNKVTIFGESAGAFSVGTHILSPLSSGLFGRAILQSGAPNAHFGRTSQAESLLMTNTLARNVKCPTDKMADTLQCLRNQTVDQILKGITSDLIQDRLFKPIYGDDLLPLRPVVALKTGKFNHKVDVMFGVTSHEGSQFAERIAPKMRSGESLTIESVKGDIEYLTNFYKLSYGNETAQYYTFKLHNQNQDQLRQAVADVWGDLHLTCPTVLFGEQFGKLSPGQHFYSYRLVRPTLAPDFNCTGWKAVCHGEDIVYLFIIPYIKSNPELSQLSRDMIHAWTSFAKTGQPGKLGDVEWTEAFERNSDHSISNPVTKHMSLDSVNYKMIPDFYKETCDVFWKPKIFI